MKTEDSQSHPSAARRAAVAIVFCVACVAVNIAGSRVVAAFNLPLYLDSIGTIVAGMMGGYLPAALVGFVTNVATSTFSSSSLYFTITSVLIGMVSAFLQNRGWFKGVVRTLASVLVIAFVGGGIGAVITWCLYGFSFGDGMTAPLVARLYATGAFSPEMSQFVGDYLLDIVDKLISVVLALGFVRAFALTGTSRIPCELWLQTPLGDEQVREAAETPSRVVSIGAKVALIIMLVMSVAVSVTTWISYAMFNESMISEQETYAFGVTDLAVQAVDPNRVDDFLYLGENAEGFAEAEAELAKIRDSFPEVQYIYAYRIEEDGCHVVLDPDTADELGSDPGDVIPFDNAFLIYRDDLLAGKPINEAIISNETYGWLLTVYVPVYDDAGTCKCYVATDILMDHIVLDGYQFLVRVITLFGAFFILICTFILWIAKYNVVLPLNTLSHVNEQLDFSDDDARAQSIERVCALDIHTGDEIENLYQAIVRTTAETARFINEAEDQAETISRMQDNLIMVMADLVESRDQFTGDHVRKTCAYVDLIMRQMRVEGIYVDQLTDEFVSDVNHSAPLHDVGKIVISDTILNKPGRLTDEEFKTMQTHTTAGREIIERAVAAVSEPTYLDMAKDIAEFHHEKWNGQGYPSGLAGEEIPLCARIMAVADVFDALVSKRSYKDGFPLEKAFAIIEEGVGTHFDPQVATAFLHVREEAARIAHEHGDVA